MGLNGAFVPEGEEYYRDRINQRTRNLIVNAWSSPMWGNGNIDAYFNGQTDPMIKPMTSLRDVDQTGIIQASFLDVNGKKQSIDEIQLVMDFLRHGVASNDGSDNA
ncbi:hypothetical protein FOT62_18865 [Serratia marcescens]|uniref:Uncharacterized protein n=1 Tax=Serratia marcescens TaxID=615 RepID=A0A5C7CAT0_SERMA|nr:hypothetical protein [Serratia marcescens]TXE30628.1 hypothetical protein FOT62_18865 [Serratia marcescens]TXE63294.1 hypothetical protein FOT56_10465 [Serratia marcescens]